MKDACDLDINSWGKWRWWRKNIHGRGLSGREPGPEATTATAGAAYNCGIGWWQITRALPARGKGLQVILRQEVDGRVA